MRRSLAPLAAASLLLLASPAAAAGVVDLSVDVTSTLEATLSSMGEDPQPVTVTGSLMVRVDVTEHPLHGLVAQNVEVLSGSVEIQDLAWSLSGANETLTASLENGGASTLPSGPIVATPIGTNTSEIPTSDIVLTVDAGELMASGTVVGHGISVARPFAADPRPISLQSLAQVVITEKPTGAIQVRLDIPIAEAVPIDPPFLVSWLELDGDLVLTGTLPSTLPATPHPGWLGAVLVVVGWLAARRRGLR